MTNFLSFFHRYEVGIGDVLTCTNQKITLDHVATETLLLITSNEIKLLKN